MSGARRNIALDVSEAIWQQQFIDLAHALGYDHMHVRRSIGKGRSWTTATNVKGWPDLTLWSERQRRLIFVELKSESGVVEPEQREVHESLRAAGCDVRVYRPSDLDEAHAHLAGRAPVAAGGEG